MPMLWKNTNQMIKRNPHTAPLKKIRWRIHKKAQLLKENNFQRSFDEQINSTYYEKQIDKNNLRG
jgi:hypothetical protein